MNRKKRILWLSDSPTTCSGFGVVAKNLLDNICLQMGERIEIDVIAISVALERPIKYNQQITIYDGRVDGDTYDNFCRSFFLNILRHSPHPYDAIFILQDFAVVGSMIPILKDIKADFLKQNKKSFKSMWYAPIDGYMHKDLIKGIEFFDHIATYTEYGKDIITAANPKLTAKIKVIPHGCNTLEFYPLSDSEKQANRSIVFENNKDKVIFVNVNRNQPRKGIVDTILAFEEAVREWDGKMHNNREPFLYLHMMRNDPMGYNLDHVFAQTSLVEGKDYMIAPERYFTSENWGVSTDMLNRIYNSCDALITTTLGEGWGLSTTEAMAARLPVICPYHTSLKYISGAGKRAKILMNLYPSCSPNDNIIREQVEISETASVMQDLSWALNNRDKKIMDMIDEAEKFVKA